MSSPTNPLGDLLSDPYPFYAMLRAQDPVHWQADWGRWLVASFDHVDAMLRDTRWSSQRTGAVMSLRSPAMQAEVRPLAEMMQRQMIFNDPPVHTRLRGVLTHAMTPRIIEGLRPWIEQQVKALLDNVIERGEMDFIADFAYPLPAIAIAHMLGIPPEDRGRFQVWSDAALAFISNLDGREEVDRHALKYVAEAEAYFKDIAERRQFGRDESLLNLLAAGEQSERLNSEELLANAVLILAGGHETTTYLIGNGLLSLLRNPEQWSRLKADPGLIESTVEECQRYESPIQTLLRISTQESEVGGKVIPPGQGVMLLVGSANRDEAAFENADTFDIARQDNRHLAMGRGVHFCVGAALARLQAQIAIGAIVERIPNVRLASDSVDWKESIDLRGPRSLPVAW